MFVWKLKRQNMLYFFQKNESLYVVAAKTLSSDDQEKLQWLFDKANYIEKNAVEGFYKGAIKNMISPWSSNAVDITKNMGIETISRIEKFEKINDKKIYHDPMLEAIYEGIGQDFFNIDHNPDPIKYIEDIAKYNHKEGLSLSDVEVTYLKEVSNNIGRKLTDSEVFGFSQINSEHCRHKIFNGTFEIDGIQQKESLFQLIKKTSKVHPNSIVSAYKDNVAFIKGPEIEHFAPKSPDKPDFYNTKRIPSIISLKAETHNFPTTVEAFNGAATGSGGEIRDRLAGGKASIPLAGTAVYMTPYNRLIRCSEKSWESIPARRWLYQSPADILIKASDGASDFGNKFGQPLICGSLLTFEHFENEQFIAYDKVIMLAGGVGFAHEKDAAKNTPKKGDRIVVLGGDNYRIGMGGAAVSSADTGEMASHIERNAVQRSNPEMQKRVANLIRGLAESDSNPIVSIHDHGAGGHLNCLSELIEDTGGIIEIDKLPVGDPSLSFKEILGNESQERMGLIVSKKDLDSIKKVAQRERAPIYEVGTVGDDKHFLVVSNKTDEKPIDLSLYHLFGNTPVTYLKGNTANKKFTSLSYTSNKIFEYTKAVLQLEAVACKDWLTNKVDRCVSGRVAKQQTCGSLQLPLNNVGVVALDYRGKKGIATSIGHAPVASLIDVKNGSKMAIVEALTNLIWAPLKDGLESVSLSANWMWSTGSEPENARLYKAVKSVSDFCIDLGINVPTGKDSLSMKQKYKGFEVPAPGTVIISATADCNDIKKVVEPVLQNDSSKKLFYINLHDNSFALGGSSFAQSQEKIGERIPHLKPASTIKNTFNIIQELIQNEYITAGHDIGSGGLITSLLEMCFPSQGIGADIDLSGLGTTGIVKILFSEANALIIQASNEIETFLSKNNIDFTYLGKSNMEGVLNIRQEQQNWSFPISKYRDIWFKTSFTLDVQQSGITKANERYDNYKTQVLKFTFPNKFDGKVHQKHIPDIQRPIAGVLREQGSNSEREMAYALHLAGFKVKDIHMSDMISGKEDLTEIDFLAAVGGFSYSDVLGSAKGWAGSIKYNENAWQAFTQFFERKNTLSLGVCNGCQLFVELGILNPEDDQKPKMLHNDSRKFECQFTSVKIQENNSVMLSNMSGTTLGIWAAHGEGKFSFPYEESKYQIPAKYAYDSYPANPNGSDYNAAMLASANGRHLAMMPHLERSTFPWNWAYYPQDRKDDNISPWIRAFENAFEWLINNKK